MTKSTGLKAIAYELGVSVNTVSRALRDCKDISEHTKEIIRKKAYELGYIQSTVANFLKKDEMKCIAIIINNLDNMYFSISCNILSHKASRNPDEILKSARFLMNKIQKVDKLHFDTMKQ